MSVQTEMIYSFTEREKLTSHPLAKKLFCLMERKQSNLAVACDVTSSKELLEIAREVGPYVSLIKTHVDILDDFDESFVIELRHLAREHDFLVFEDRKFADIGNTVYYQYAKGIYRISSWADIVNAHALPGEGIVEGLAKEGQGRNRGLLLLAQMSSQGSYRDESYIRHTEAIARSYPEFVMGFISQERLYPDPEWIWMTPGIKMGKGGDTLKQQYNDPKTAILERHNDIIIVGRDIILDRNPAQRAKLYQQEAWGAHQQRL